MGRFHVRRSSLAVICRTETAVSQRLPDLQEMTHYGSANDDAQLQPLAVVATDFGRVRIACNITSPLDSRLRGNDVRSLAAH